MAKQPKKAKPTNIDPVKVKLGVLIFLTIVLCVSGYLLITKNNGDTSISEPTRIEGTN